MSLEPENAPSEPLPQQTLEAVAKSLHRQAVEYGFGREDYVRFVNILLDLGMEHSGQYTPPASTRSSALVDGPAQTGSAVEVRLCQPEDLPLLRGWIEDSVGQAFLTTRPDATRKTLEELLAAESSLFGIVSLDNKPIGALAYLNIDLERRSAELRKLIGEPAARGQGYARRATQYWIEYGLAHLRLHKIYVNTLETNLANIHLNESLGFRVEGLLRDEILLDGQWRDVLRMSLIVPD